MNDYQAPADLLKGKVILITGAGDGIGAQQRGLTQNMVPPVFY